MTQRVDFCVGDTMSIHQSIIATNRLYLTEHHTLRVILSGAAQRCNGATVQRRTRKPIIAAESNPEGAPAGGISALEYGIVQSLTSNFPPKWNDTWVVPYNIAIVPHTSNKREAALRKNALPPKPTKNFPQEHPPKTKRTKSSHCIGGCSWGKFGVGQGGLEGRENPSERGLPAPPRSSPPTSRTATAFFRWSP